MLANDNGMNFISIRSNASEHDRSSRVSVQIQDQWRSSGSVIDRLSTAYYSCNSKKMLIKPSSTPKSSPVRNTRHIPMASPGLCPVCSPSPTASPHVSFHPSRNSMGSPCFCIELEKDHQQPSSQDKLNPSD